MARTNMNLPDNIDREMRHEAIDLGLRYPGEFVQHLWKQYKKYKEVEKMRNWKEIYKAKEKDEAGYVLVTSGEMGVDDLEDEIWDEIETQGCKCAVGEYDEENNLKSLLFTVWE